jgi:hypothetical protein
MTGKMPVADFFPQDSQILSPGLVAGLFSFFMTCLWEGCGDPYRNQRVN